MEMPGEGNRKEYVAMIVQRSNPRLNEILSFFDSEINMFNENKPPG